jgi:hypothetical protein
VKALRIKALALNLGYAESQRASTLLVRWDGKPFTDARAAVESFYDACRAALVSPVPKRAACCQKTLAAKPSAKACPDCGVSFASKRKHVSMYQYLASIATMECDGSARVLYPHDNAPDEVENGESVLGGWAFFGGFPDDCDVVEVLHADRPFAESGAMAAEFRVIHVGKAATRASARGEIPVATEV